MPQGSYLIKNPAISDGTSRRQRTLAALAPTSVMVDERSLEDFLVFALDFSRQVRYYDLQNHPDGNWEDFWACDPTIAIAVISKTNPLPLKIALESELALPPTVQGVQPIFHLLGDLAGKMDDWYKKLVPGTGFHSEVKRLLLANFKNLLPQLLAYEREAEIQLPNYPDVDPAKYDHFTPVWGNPLIDLPEIQPSGLFRPAAVIDDESHAPCLHDIGLNEKLAAAYSKLQDIFTGLYNVYFHIIQIAPVHFKSSLERKDHPAHLALFITFLMLYRHVQDDLNRITQRHLDFFYKDVLGFSPKPAVPDKVHLFFELAKNVLEHGLDADTRFKAGKDSTGLELLYALSKAGVFNTAKVENLRTLYLHQAAGPGTAEPKVKNIHAAPFADSADGLGTKITDEDIPAWATLGSRAMPKAAIGFAIASRDLLLGEGKRAISLEVHTEQEIEIAGEQPFAVSISGEQGWMPLAYAVENLGSSNGFRLSFEVLDEEQPPVVPFDADAFGEMLPTDLPVMKVLLRQPTMVGPDQEYYYDWLQGLTLEKLVLRTEVSGCQSVTIFNDEGAVDVKKPFLPFGTSPKVGSSLYVGHLEAFQKNLNALTLHLHWEQVPTDLKKHYRGYDGVDNLNHNNFTAGVASIGKTEYPSPVNIAIFDTPASVQEEYTDEKVNLELLNSNVKLAGLLSENGAENYGIDTKEGFLRLDLQRDFEHDQFQQVLTRQMLAVSRFPNRVIGAWYLVNGEAKKATTNAPTNNEISNSEVIIPRTPFTPSLKSLSLSYVSILDTDATSQTSSLTFLHLHPFPDTFQIIAPQKKHHLLPQFTAKVTRKPAVDRHCSHCKPETQPLPEPSRVEMAHEEGALFIGLSGLLPRQSLSLLFQMAENTADADLPKSMLRWYYLADNEWKAFEPFQIVSDTTNAFIQSGIVELSIPPGINRNNTILPAHWHWLKASVAEHAGSVSKLIGVHAQAALATFRDNGNDPTRLAFPLPPQTIGKLENDDSAIKGIHQLYQSFGGNPPEDSLSFYTRVSERLRHKGRAVAMFDYERLVLEAFPGIYKVKCINHTDDQHRISPGHVLISVIPDYSKLVGVDRRQPKVTLAMLEQIKRFLEERNCDFVAAEDCTLHVLNPIYETITVKFDVRFMPEITAIDFHIRKLKDAIVRFLSPWAYDDATEINFGGKVFRSSILHFVEKQPYVDYVVNFEMMHAGAAQNLAMIVAGTPRSILVPVPAEEFEIRHLSEEHSCEAKNLIQKNTLGYINLGETILDP